MPTMVKSLTTLTTESSNLSSIPKTYYFRRELTPASCPECSTAGLDT